MGCREMEKAQGQRETAATSKVWVEKMRVYICNGRAKTGNNGKSH